MTNHLDNSKLIISKKIVACDGSRVKSDHRIPGTIREIWGEILICRRFVFAGAPRRGPTVAQAKIFVDHVKISIKFDVCLENASAPPTGLLKTQIFEANHVAIDVAVLS